MAEIKTVSLSIGETINIGNFSNFKYEVSATAQVDGGDPEAALNEVEEFIKKRAMKIRQKASGENKDG